MPFVWCLGYFALALVILQMFTHGFVRSILGPALGGALAQPCDSYPNLFARGTLFDRFPFLLPNLVCAMILAFGVLIGVLFLEETHELKKNRPDMGLEYGKWILSHFSKNSSVNFLDKAGDANIEESRPLVEDELPPGYRTTEGSPRDPSSRAQSPGLKTGLKNKVPIKKPPGTQHAFTKQVVLNIVGYGILA